ncbi:MAG: hypothetical protein V2J08_16550, partial [Desulfotignum sp.]|nr:hypothetical protein [Desulfotignum sp.]
MNSVKRWIMALMFVMGSSLALEAAPPVYPFFDDMESGTGNWEAQLPWTLSQETSHSPAHAWSDSPGGYYENNADTTLTLAAPLDLS